MGEINEEKEDIIDLLKENCTQENDWKVFTIGIIDKESESHEDCISLVEDCAYHGRGSYSLVDDSCFDKVNGGLKGETVKQLKRAMAPAI